MKDLDCDLLIVGLGPVGVAAACLAARHGLSAIAIDREADIFPLPRAAVFDHEIMRIFQSFGMAERIAPLCRAPDRYQFVTARGEILLDFDLDGVSPISAWRESYALHQPAVEAALRARAAEMGADLRTQTSLVSFTQDSDGVSADLHGPSGASYIRARYLIGCDGASSFVRQSLDIGLFDYQFDEPWLVIDAVADGPSPLPITCRQICDPAQPVTYMAMSAPRYRWEFMLKPGDDPESFSTDANVRRLLRDWDGAEDLRFERRAIYRFHGLVANTWRKDRILLAGDAAHQMPPFAGQGMCSGIRDAQNLIWKLHRVIHGQAPGTLLDTYQQEREPHVRAIIETAIEMGRIVCLLDPQAAAARDADMLARKASGAQDISLHYPDLVSGFLMQTPAAGALFPQAMAGDTRFDDAAGDGFWLVGRGVAALTAPEGVSLCDLDAPRFRPFAAAIEAWLTEARADAVLVRPDRHVFGAGRAQDLLAALRAA